MTRIERDKHLKVTPIISSQQAEGYHKDQKTPGQLESERKAKEQSLRTQCDWCCNFVPCDEITEWHWNDGHKLFRQNIDINLCPTCRNEVHDLFKNHGIEPIIKKTQLPCNQRKK